MKYDESWRTPAAVLDVIVRPRRRSSQSVRVRAMLDTGSGITVIPPFVVSDLQLSSRDVVLVVGYDEKETERETYLVSLEFLDYKFDGVRVVVAPRTTMLLGRDLLNRFVITLDGPAHEFELTLS